MNNDIESGDNLFSGGEIVPPEVGLPCGKEANTDSKQQFAKRAPKFRSVYDTEKFLAKRQAEDRDSWAKLYVSLVPFIRMRAATHAGKSVGRQREDLEQEGALALREVVKTYDPSKGTKLETYARACIEHAMIDYMRKHDRNGNRTISLEETLEDVQSRAALRSHLIDVKVTVSQEDQRRSELVKANLGILTPRERDVLILRYGLKDGEPKTQVEVANLVGVSQARVAEIEKLATNKLKRRLAGSS